MKKMFLKTSVLFLTLVISVSALADENLFGYVKGAETLPEGAWEVYQWTTSRSDKGMGTYQAYDFKTEFEHGVTSRFTAGFALKMQSLKIKDILIDAYIPKDIYSGLQASGAEILMKYNFLSAAKDDIGLSTYMSLDYAWLDPHSGQGKDTTSFELELLLQKYFLEGELIFVYNLGMESTYADRHEVSDLPPGFEWPTHPEMEIELKTGMGLTYRFVPNWFVGGEALYESEYETEVGQERWSTFAGPTLHYGVEKWWATLTWFKQLEGGPEFDGQEGGRLHLIEKTKQEIRLKLGYNF